MEAIQEQIKTGKVSGKDLLKFFSSPGGENHEIIYKILTESLISTPEMLVNLALILYRSGLFELFEKLINKLRKFLGILKNDKNLFVYLSLVNLINNKLIIFDISSMAEALTLFFKYYYITNSNKYLILFDIPDKYWDYNSLYALYLTNPADLNTLIERHEGMFLSLNPSKEIVDIIKNNGDEDFFKIIHYYDLPKRITNKIRVIGPISLSKHSSIKYNKTIYIFGDRHVISPTCEKDENVQGIDIVDFIKYNIENTNKIIDLFMESQIPKKEGDVHVVTNNYLTKMRTLSRKGLYPNFRYHHGDPRRSYIHKIYEIFDRNTTMLLYDFSNENLEIVKNWIDETLLSFKPSNFINSKAEKQLSNIKNIEIFNILKNYETDEIDNVRTYFLNEASKLKKLIDDTIKYRQNRKVPEIYIDRDAYYDSVLNPNKLSGEIEIKMERLKEKLFNIDVVSMDLYLMGRIFRNFKNEPEAQNIIIYTGDAHSETYRKLLKEIGFKEEGYIKRKDPGEPGFQCLDISQFKLPFFA